MSEVRAAVTSLMGFSKSLWLAIASFFFVSLWRTIRFTFKRKHPIELVTNEENSAPVSGEGSITIIEMIKEKCPSLYGPKAYYRPTWWLPGYVKVSILHSHGHAFDDEKHCVVFSSSGGIFKPFGASSASSYTVMKFRKSWKTQGWRWS